MGSAGQFPVNRPLLRECTQAEAETYSECLCDSNSLIGQLCPALRLCLAAEVATGLLCDRWVGGWVGGWVGQTRIWRCLKICLLGSSDAGLEGCLFASFRRTNMRLATVAAAAVVVVAPVCPCTSLERGLQLATYLDTPPTVLLYHLSTLFLPGSQPAPPDTPEHASALLLFLAAALKQAEQECDIPLKHQQESAWALNPTMDVLKTLIDFTACPEPLGALQQLYGQLSSVLAASGSTVANLGEPGATENPVLRALSIGFQLAQPPAASPQQFECHMQQQELAQQQNQRQAEQQPDCHRQQQEPAEQQQQEPAEQQQGQQPVHAAAGSSSSNSSSSTSSAAASSPAPTAGDVYARLLHMFAAEHHGAPAAAAAAPALDGTTTQQQQQQQQQQAAAVAEVVKDIITLMDSFLNELVSAQQQVPEQPPCTSPADSAAAPANAADAAIVAPDNASTDAAQGVASTGSAETVNACAAGTLGRDSDPTSSSSSSSSGIDDDVFDNPTASLSSIKRARSLAALITTVTGSLAFKLLLETLRQVFGEWPTQGSGPQGSAAGLQAASPQGSAAEAPAGDLAAGPEGSGAQADAAEGLPAPEGASVQLWLQQCGVVQAALLVTEIQALYDTVVTALLAASEKWQWVQQQQQQQQQEQQQQQPEGNEQQEQQEQLQPDHNQQLPEQAEAPIEGPRAQCTCPVCTSSCTIKANTKQVITQKVS